MTYDLYIGDRTYSSWSMRGWLSLEKFGLPFRSHMMGLYDGTLAQDLSPLGTARTVPAMRTKDGCILTDSLSIAETLAERHPDAGLYPQDAKLRAKARNLVAEMHGGFTALRSDCPMNLARAWRGFAPSDAVRADLARIDTIWADAASSSKGPWLLGEYSLADVFFAPVAARIATYDLPVGDVARAYVEATLSDTSFRRWRAMGAIKEYSPEPYLMDLEERIWPGPAPMQARPVAKGPSENDRCPYSGDPVTHFMECAERRFGFCNAFCRDKTVADPAAWPMFMAIFGA